MPTIRDRADGVDLDARATDRRHRDGAVAYDPAACVGRRTRSEEEIALMSVGSVLGGRARYPRPWGAQHRGDAESTCPAPTAVMIVSAAIAARMRARAGSGRRAQSGMTACLSAQEAANDRGRRGVAEQPVPRRRRPRLRPGRRRAPLHLFGDRTGTQAALLAATPFYELVHACTSASVTSTTPSTASRAARHSDLPAEGTAPWSVSCSTLRGGPRRCSPDTCRQVNAQVIAFENESPPTWRPGLRM